MHFLTFVVKNLLRRRLRSALTCAGVAVAIGTMVALLGAADSIGRTSAESFARQGAVDLIVNTKGLLNQLSSDLDQRAAAKIAAIPGVRVVTYALLDLIEVPRGSGVISAIVQGWDPDSFLFDILKPVSGRLLRPGDEYAVVLGENLAATLNKKVGDTLEIQGANFEVVGVFHSFTVYENGSAITPLKTLQQVMLRPNRVTGFSVGLDAVPADQRDALMLGVQEAIAGLKDDHGRPYNFVAQPTEGFARNSAHMQILHAMAWVTSVIAVLLGAIGMLNTMIMSVLERVKEIGILRAVGWRKGRVVRMILGESLVLSLAGAALGALGAMILSKVLSMAPAANGFLEGTIPAAVIARGFLMAAIVGLVGGTYPAYRAAQLLPTEALRHE